MLNTIEGGVSAEEGYVPSMSITKDGQTAYFSKATYQKPLYGVFSKKELIHEIYRAELVNGEWTNITKMAVCPEHYSAKHFRRWEKIVLRFQHEGQLWKI